MKYQDFKNEIENILDPSKKTVVFFSLYSNYIKLFGTLHDTFRKNNWNIVNLVTKYSHDVYFTRKAHTFIIPNFENYKFIDTLNLNFVDLIISVNAVDKNFISYKAKGIYLPHDVLRGIIPSSGTQYIFSGTNFSIKNVQTDKYIYKAYNNKSKCFISGGYPRLDAAVNYYKKNKNKKLENSILYMPTQRCPENLTQNQLNYFIGFDSNLIEILLMNFDLDIIVNNHPSDKITNSKYLDLLFKRFEKNQRIHINKIDIDTSYIKSKLLITDTSDTAFTYSFTTLKQSLFYTPEKGLNSKEKPTNIIGYEVNSLSEICEKVNYILMNPKKLKTQIKKYRNNKYFNFLRSEQYLIDNIDYILNNKIHKDWIYT